MTFDQEHLVCEAILQIKQLGLLVVMAFPELHLAGLPLGDETMLVVNHIDVLNIVEAFKQIDILTSKTSLRSRWLFQSRTEPSCEYLSWAS